MNDTPRTYEQINGKPCTRFAILAGDSLRDALVPSEFCRQLERELNAANRCISRLVQAGDCLLSHRNSTDYHEKVREWDKAKKDKP